jgi:tetratricopeptide (TPR) repeat protein
MKRRLSIAHLLAFGALIAVLIGAGLVVRWAILNQGALIGTVEPGKQPVNQLIPSRILEAMGLQSGGGLRAPSLDAIESHFQSVSEVPMPSDEEITGLSVQSRETLRLRYNLGLLRYHQNDTPAAIAAFRSVLEVDPQGVYGRRAFLQLGMIHLSEEQLAEAIRAFEKAVALDASDPYAAHNLGVAYLRAGKTDAAIRLLNEAARLDAANSGILQNLGNAHLAAGAMDQARAAFEQAIKVQGTNAAARFNLGIVHYRAERWREAEEAFAAAIPGLEGADRARDEAFLGMSRFQRGFFGPAAEAFAKAAATDPSNASHRFNQGVALAKSGLSTEAAAAFRAALLVDGRDPAAWFGLGGVLYADARRDDALEAYKKGLEFDSRATGPLFTIGYIHLERGEIDEAMTRFHDVIRINPQGEDAKRAHVNLGLCHESRGDLEAAAREYEAGAPNDPRTFYNLGLVRRKMNDPARAVEAFQRASDLNPKESRYAAALGDAYMEAQNPDAAVTAYERAVKEGGDDFELLIRLAQNTTRLSRLQESENWLKRAVAVAKPGSDRARAFITEGLLKDRRGLLDDALQAFRRAVAEDRSNPDAYYNLGVLYARLRDYDAAVDALRVAVRLKPGHADAHTQLGNIFAARGLREEAAIEYEAAVRIDSGQIEATFNLQELTGRR